MKDVILMDKRVGETPLECMNRFRADNPLYANVKMTYAGRLDPMASGLLVVLAGGMVHKKEEFLKLSKTYECTALLGVATDTYDVLGMPTEVAPPHDSGEGGLPQASRERFEKVTTEGCQEKVQEALQKTVGTFQQPYPPYSSKTVDGKQLHQIAREGAIGSVTVPSQMVTVESVRDIGEAAVSLRETAADIVSRIRLVTGDFRQEAIIAAWNALATAHPDGIFIAVSFTISVSGGTYIRGIVHELGKRLGTGACIWKLHRTRVGTYLL